MAVPAHPPWAVALLASVTLFAFSAGCASDDGPRADNPDARVPGDGGDEASPADGARPDGRPPGPARVVIGTGVVEFTEVPEQDATLDLVHGPQGGWHLTVAAQVHGLEPAGLLLAYEMYRPGQADPLNKPATYMLREGRVMWVGDHFERLNDICEFDVEDPAEVVGDTVILRVVATPLDGETVMDERTLTVTDVDGI